MSSGNPFRTTPSSYSPASSSPVPQTSFINYDSSVPEAREDGRSGLEDANAPPPKTKKHVRIQSNTTFIPPHPASADVGDSPTDSFSQSPGQTQSQNAGFPFTAAFQPSANSYMNAGEPTAPSTWQGSDMAVTDIFSSSKRGSSAPQSAVSPSGIPANPFSRTLASLEPQERGTVEDKTTAEKATLGNNRKSLDVESFKNLLMTGKTVPRQTGQTAQAQALSGALGGPQFESSSSTDTSSISRQSLFEQHQATLADTPRTSYEMADSDEEEVPEVTSDSRTTKKKPPPAPKHRHGKPVTPRQPQVVPFADFAASEPAASPITRPRDNSDASKPLPPIPAIASPPLHIITTDASIDRPTPVEQRSSDSLPVSDTPQPQKKTPPPVPLARRQSQLRTSTTGNRSRSNSSLTMSSQISVDAPLPSPASSNRDPLTPAKAPPPPPRSRHGVRLNDIGSSSANSSTTELPSRSASVRTAAPAPAQQDHTSSQKNTLEPDPTLSNSDIQRTSSISSNRNTRVVSNESTTSTGSNMPPPPPPRRRNRSSLDQQRPVIPASPNSSRRTSTEYRRTSLDNKRRTSVASESSLRHEYATSEDKREVEHPLYSPQEESENKLGALEDRGIDEVAGEQRKDSNNILDDMEKFQREIDELRQKFKQAG